MILARLLFQTVVLALGQIWSNKIRALLTTLGIIVGVASILAVIAALSGLKTSILNEFEKFGSRRVFIDGDVPQSKWPGMSWREVQLRVEEIRALQAGCKSLDTIAPEWWGSYEVANGQKVLPSIGVVGIWPEWHTIVGRQVTSGRPFNSVDEEQHLQVCLINDKAIGELNLDKDPVGDLILIAGRRFMIVGVVETLTFGILGGGDTETEVFIPFGTARNLNPDGWINMAWGQLALGVEPAEAEAEVTFMLRRMRQLRPEDENTFEVQFLQNVIDQFNKVAATITAGAAGIVGISLLVGGIGIMNIMLVSVSERTREIGLRKAVGAKPATVLLQFLVEAVTLCIVGGLLGLAVAQGLVMLVKRIPNANLGDAGIPLWAISLALGFSAATGIIFGMFPAIKAARLNPIDALRHE